MTQSTMTIAPLESADGLLLQCQARIHQLEEELAHLQGDYYDSQSEAREPLDSNVSLNVSSRDLSQGRSQPRLQSSKRLQANLKRMMDLKEQVRITVRVQSAVTLHQHPPYSHHSRQKRTYGCVYN